jgi:hypothetical protein
MYLTCSLKKTPDFHLAVVEPVSDRRMIDRSRKHGTRSDRSWDKWIVQTFLESDKSE